MPAYNQVAILRTPVMAYPTCLQMKIEIIPGSNRKIKLWKFCEMNLQYTVLCCKLLSFLQNVHNLTVLIQVGVFSDTVLSDNYTIVC